jgi:YcxB-like protein
VWEWYWRFWRQHGWKTHALLFLTVSAAGLVGSYAGGHGKLTQTSFLLAPVFGFFPILLMVVYPQLRFTSQMRRLEMDQEGISTLVGKQSGRRSWKEVLSVSEQDDRIIILTRRGAFIIPVRAFASIEQRKAFISFARSAVAAA